MNLKTTGSLNVMVVDDSTTNRLLMKVMLQKMGYSVTLAENGINALELCEQSMPDLVLMDVQMPGMNGFEVVLEMRRRYTDWFPILYLSASTSNVEVVEGLRAGGDDYLFKPVNYEILKAKIHQFQVRLEQSIQLVKFRDQTEEETQVARCFIEQFTHLDNLHDPWVKFLFKPAEQFSGDMIAFARSPNGSLNLLLADSTGHGLTSALAVIPIIQPFYQMTQKGFDMETILTEINTKVRSYLPLPRFVAAAMVSIKLDSGLIRVWNGGLPDVLVLSEDGNRTLHSFKSRHLPFGVLSQDEFVKTSEYFNPASQSNHLLLCTDGVTEIAVGDNQLLGQEGLLQGIRASASPSIFDKAVEVIGKSLAGTEPADDIGMIVVSYPGMNAGSELPELPELPSNEKYENFCRTGDVGWEASFVLRATQLKKLDVVPFLIGIVKQIEDGHSDSKLFLVLSELFNNALDHGVLKLDSKLKNDPEGMEFYYDERSQRLADLETGQITLCFEKIECSNESSKECGKECSKECSKYRCLKVSLADSGAGFDFVKELSRDISDNVFRHGRGISLVAKICTGLQYLGSGSEVVAFLEMSDSPL